MHLNIWRTLALIATPLLAACEYSPNSIDRVIAYNRTIATSTNELFLLNAVRASKRNPAFYSRTTGDTANSTFTPGLMSSIPLGSISTLASAAAMGSTFGSTGALMGSSAMNTVTNTTMKNPVNLSPGLSYTDQSQLALQNLDDQGFVNGLMAPVPMTTFGYYQNEGWNTEELLLMFVDSVKLKKFQLAKLPEYVKAACAKRNDIPRIAECTLLADGAANTIISPACMIGTPYDNKPANDQTSFLFANDPALYRTVEGVRDFYDFDCFQQVARALVALGIHPTTASSYRVLYRVPLSMVRENPRYLADLTAQNLEVAILPASRAMKNDEYLAVCKKTDTSSFELAGSALLEESKGEAQPATRVGDTTVAQALSVVVDNKPIVENTPGASQIPAAQVAAKTCIDAAKNFKPDTAPDAKRSSDNAIDITTRSLEAMVYYIGQIIRRRVELAEAIPVTFLNAANDSAIPYHEELFRVETGSADSNSIVQVDSDGTTYFVPPLCTDTNCSVEYPSHATPQILTLLNQIWGLQKTIATLPIVPTVTVINPP